MRARAELEGLAQASQPGHRGARAECVRRWAAVVIDGSLAVLGQRGSDATARTAMRHLLVALCISSPALLQGGVASRVLTEVLALRDEDVRIEALLVLFWRFVWAGVGEMWESDGAEGQSLLHSEVMMEFMQRDPDGSEGVLALVAATYAQACLLPPPPYRQNRCILVYALCLGLLCWFMPTRNRETGAATTPIHDMKCGRS